VNVVARLMQARQRELAELRVRFPDKTPEQLARRIDTLARYRGRNQDETLQKLSRAELRAYLRRIRALAN
jgi:DNA-binding transcriptional regulator WhiA